MSINGPFILAPVEITDAVLDSSTVAEPAAGETAWVSAGTYAVGDQRIRATTHRIYSCILAHTGITTLPEDDLTRWKDIGPDLRWAMFDGTVSTDTTATATLTVVLSPGFFNAIALYKLTGSHITVTVKDEPGGTTIYTYDDDLYEPFPDWYEWLFAPYRDRDRLILRDIVPYMDAELTITVTAAPAAAVGIGMARDHLAQGLCRLAVNPVDLRRTGRVEVEYRPLRCPHPLADRRGALRRRHAARTGSSPARTSVLPLPSLAVQRSR